MDMIDFPRMPATEGGAGHTILRPGLSLHAGVGRHSKDCEGQVVVDDCVRIVFALEGSLDLSYGGKPVRLQAVGAGQSGRAYDAALVTLQEPACFRRVARRGEFSRRISIGLARRWIDDTLGLAEGSARAIVDRHLETAFWKASPRMRVLVEQMLAPPSLQPQLVGLYQETRAIELVIEALSMGDRQRGTETAAANQSRRLTPAAHQRICDLKAWLVEHAMQPLCLAQIAAQLHTTPSTLQRHFRLVHGMTVFDFLQQQRLAQARQALERDGVSVGYAATLAGYANATSFATAFRRRFGLSPKQARLCS